MRTPLHGKPVYGASVGMLMLDTRFARIVGDGGNALTWPFPVHFKVVQGADAQRVVCQGGAGTLDMFIEAAKELIALGADGIAMNCGFLSVFQDRMSAAIGAPVVSSALMQVPMVQSILPRDKRVGILTIDQDTLSSRHLMSANVPLDTPVRGVDKTGNFYATMVNGQMDFDVKASRKELLAAAGALAQENPDLGAIVLECTNMIPFAHDIQRHTGMPVYSYYSLVTWFQSGLTPRQF